MPFSETSTHRSSHFRSEKLYKQDLFKGFCETLIKKTCVVMRLQIDMLRYSFLSFTQVNHFMLLISLYTLETSGFPMNSSGIARERPVARNELIYFIAVTLKVIFIKRKISGRQMVNGKFSRDVGWFLVRKSIFHCNLEV